MSKEEIILEKDVFHVFQCRVIVDGWIKVEEHRQLYFFSRGKQLIFKAETLNFVKVNHSIIWFNLVYWKTNYRFVWPVISFVEDKGCFSSIDHNGSLLRFKEPVKFIINSCVQMNVKLFMYQCSFCLLAIILMRGLCWKSPFFTKDLVQGNN